MPPPSQLTLMYNLPGKLAKFLPPVPIAILQRHYTCILLVLKHLTMIHTYNEILTNQSSTHLPPFLRNSTAVPSILAILPHFTSYKVFTTSFVVNTPLGDSYLAYLTEPNTLRLSIYDTRSLQELLSRGWWWQKFPLILVLICLPHIHQSMHSSLIPVFFHSLSSCHRWSSSQSL